VSRFDSLLSAYAARVQAPWPTSVSGAERVWLAVYEPDQERRIRVRLGEFETVTIQAGHSWNLVDLTDAFGRWLGRHEYRDAYFARPTALAPALAEFRDTLTAQVAEVLAKADSNAVVALLGVGALFGLARVSELVERVAPAIPGRLLVFFPGRRVGANYRLLDAKDGWDYLAIPIEAASGG